MKICTRILIVFFCLLTSSLSILTSKACASELSYIHSDHLGSTSLVTDEQGNVVSQQVYYPYGNTRSKLTADGLQSTAREYTGQVSDQAETELYYYNARYYDPTIAKFTQADKAQGLNRYSYVSNNPIVRTDPSGHMDQAEGGGGYMHTKPKQGIWIGETYYANGYPGCSTGAGWAVPGNCGAPSFPQAPSLEDTLLVMGAASGGLGMAWAATPVAYVTATEMAHGTHSFASNKSGGDKLNTMDNKTSPLTTNINYYTNRYGSEIGEGYFGKVFAKKGVATKVFDMSKPTMFNWGPTEELLAERAFYQQWGGQFGLPKYLGEVPFGYQMEELAGAQRLDTFLEAGGELSPSAIYKAVKNLMDFHRIVGRTHEDITPWNVLVMPDGNVRFIDANMVYFRPFGGARETRYVLNLLRGIEK